MAKRAVRRSPVPRDTTTADMREKLAWAKRCFARVKAGHAAHEHDIVQDNIWSFIHASRLVFFYLGRFFESRDLNGKARKLVDSWLATKSEHDRLVWRNVEALRTYDVHTGPLTTGIQKGNRCKIVGKRIVVRNGGKVIGGDGALVIHHKNISYDFFSMAKAWLVLANDLISFFESAVEP